MTELTDKMRTCAAYIMSRPHDAPMPTEHLLDDAASLLIEASNLLEAAPAPLGEPVKIIEPITPAQVQAIAEFRGTWTSAGDTLSVANPYRTPRTCPHCDSRAIKTVRRIGGRMMLECPACGLQWEWQ